MTLTLSEEFYGFNFSISINHADFQAVHGQTLTEGLGIDMGGKSWPKLSLLYPSLLSVYSWEFSHFNLHNLIKNTHICRA